MRCPRCNEVLLIRENGLVFSYIRNDGVIVHVNTESMTVLEFVRKRDELLACGFYRMKKESICTMRKAR